MFNEERWRLWEKFGACYHAMKINSFVRLGIKEISIGELHQGADMRSEIRDIRVKLKPVKIICSGAPMHPKLEPVLHSFGAATPFDWTTGSYIVLNAHNGEGIDMWTCYERVTNGSLIIDADQRKAISKPAQLGVVEAIAKSALGILPDEVNRKKVIKIIGCMMVTSERKLKEHSEPTSHMALPELTYLVTKREAAAYHGIFSSYGPANPVISINDTTLTKSSLAYAMSGDTTKCFKIAGEILEERKVNGPFKDEEDLRRRVPSMGNGQSKESTKLSEYISFR
jgi:hypothetical protein